MLFPVERWRGALGRGEALESQGQRAGAVAAYEAAERALDDAIVRVPLEGGRETFLADREASARALVDLLVRMGKPQQALLRARATRARVLTMLVGSAQIAALSSDGRQKWLAAIDEYRGAREALAAEAGADWRRTKQELARSRATRRDLEERARAILDGALASVDRRPARAAFPMPPDDAVLLAWFPVRHGWMAFAATRGRVRAVPFELPPLDSAPALVSRALLDPFANELAHATSLLLLPHGAAQSIDVHALPWGGRPLNATVASRYVVDLGDAPEGRGDQALVLFDPTSDLQAARAEGITVRAALERAGTWPVKALTGTAITPGALAAELPASALVHFAGHAAYEGRDGWESAFALAGGARWSVGDVLALTHSPPRVVLSACEAARSSTDSAEGIGLAQAFLVAGARVVLAPARAVDDDLARAMSEALYAALGRGGDLVAALHEAQEVVRASRPTSDWSAFRAVTR